MSNTQSVKAVAKYIRMSPHKIRRVLNQIRGRSYQEALMVLEFLPYEASNPVWQVVYSAAENAKQIILPFMRFKKSALISNLLQEK